MGVDRFARFLVLRDAARAHRRVCPDCGVAPETAVVRPAIYTDGVHLASPNLEVLHRFAAGIGLRREALHGGEAHPHYDLTSVAAYHRAITAGAVEVELRALVSLCYPRQPARRSAGARG